MGLEGIENHGSCHGKAYTWIIDSKVNSMIIFKKEMQDLYIKNCKALLKEIKKDLNKWEYIHVSWIIRLNKIE